MRCACCARDRRLDARGQDGIGLTGDGVAEVWEVIGRFMKAVGEKGIAAAAPTRRSAWMWNEVGETLLAELRKHPG